jgi:ABC-type polysaccharide/polyol phosphate export permease
MAIAAQRALPVLELGPEPGSVMSWLRSVVAHREVLLALAAKDFKVRYKRATFGILWAVALPLLQSAVMIVVFSRVTKVDTDGFDYTGYVLAGMAGWAFAATTISSAATAIVDGSSLTDKVWFPRALLVLAPVLANLIGLAIAVTIVGLVQVVRTGVHLHLLLLVPATALLVALVSGICLTAAALHVQFRDVRFLVQAGLLVLFYATPVLYPLSLLGGLAPVDRAINPFVGTVQLFQAALAGVDPSGVAVGASAGWAVALLLLAVHLHRRDDRLFVDLL